MPALVVPQDEFEKQLLHEDLIDQYRSRLGSVRRETAREFWREAEYRRGEKRAGIELERRHRTLLNLSVFPFTGGQGCAQLGYNFVRASPLLELGLPNLDFLIANLSTDPITIILGEAKGTIQDPSQVVRQTRERRAVALQHFDHINEKYLGVAPDTTVRSEFVIACPSTEAPELIRAVAANAPDIVVWHAPLAGSPVLKLASPPDIPNRHGMLHGDRRLNDALRGVPSSRTCFDLWPSIHPALALSATYRRVERADRDLFTTPEIVREVVATDMFYLSELEVTAQVKGIIDLAVRIELIRPVAGSTKYRVANAKELRSTTDARAVSRWIEATLHDDLERLVASKTESLQGEFRKLREQRPVLDDHW